MFKHAAELLILMFCASISLNATARTAPFIHSESLTSNDIHSALNVHFLSTLSFCSFLEIQPEILQIDPSEGPLTHREKAPGRRPGPVTNPIEEYFPMAVVNCFMRPHYVGRHFIFRHAL